MGQPYVGEIRLFGGNFAPAGWAFCDGQLMSIADNDTLFNLIGATYGGDGQNTFAMPDMRGRVPVHMGTAAGQTYVIGQAAGAEAVTLTQSTTPQHTHPMMSNNTPGAFDKASSTTVLADLGPAGVIVNAYIPYDGTNQVALSGQSVTAAGGGQPHDNMQPYLGVNFIISLYGVFPSQN
ncbi:tail fiber protein [soil metagenome]